MGWSEGGPSEAGEDESPAGVGRGGRGVRGVGWGYKSGWLVAALRTSERPRIGQDASLPSSLQTLPFSSLSHSRPVMFLRKPRLNEYALGPCTRRADVFSLGATGDSNVFRHMRFPRSTLTLALLKGGHVCIFVRSEPKFETTVSTQPFQRREVRTGHDGRPHCVLMPPTRRAGSSVTT